MNWFGKMIAAFTLFMGALICNILIVNAQCPDPSVLNINMLKKNGGTTDICCDGCIEPPQNHKYVASIKPQDGSQTYFESVAVVGDCVNFAFDTSIATAGNSLDIALQLLDDVTGCPTATGLKVINAFPQLPQTPTASMGAEPATTETIIRVTGDMGDCKIQEVTTGYEVTDEINHVTYYFTEDTNPPTALTPCDNSNAVSVCDEPVPHSTANFDNPITVNRATLIYQDGSPGTISAEAEITPGPILPRATTTTFDIITISEDKADNSLCTGNDGVSISCNINWTPGDKIADIRLVQINDGVPFAYQENPIQDRELLFTLIGTASVEARWLFVGDIGPARKYQMTLDTEPSTTLNVATVDCSGMGVASLHCFGYFTSVVPNTYRITLQSQVSGNFDPTAEIRSKEILVPEPPPPNNKVLQPHVSRVHWRTTSVVEVEVCIDHPGQKTEPDYGFFDLIIINADNQWLKQKIKALETQNDTKCFEPLLVSTRDFEIDGGAKLLVVKRDADGFSVLASGETWVDF